MIYFSDGVNQYGTNSSLWKQITEAALKSTGDVTAMWNATKAYTQSYLTRREQVYKMVLALNLKDASSSPEHTKTQEERTIDNAITDGAITDRTYWLGVLNGNFHANPEYIRLAFNNYHTKLSKELSKN